MNNFWLSEDTFSLQETEDHGGYSTVGCQLSIRDSLIYYCLPKN